MASRALIWKSGNILDCCRGFTPKIKLTSEQATNGIIKTNEDEGIKALMKIYIQIYLNRIEYKVLYRMGDTVIPALAILNWRKAQGCERVSASALVNYKN